MKIKTLNHCPFCRSAEVIIREETITHTHEAGDHSYSSNYYVECKTCKARGPLSKKSEEKAVALWQYNTHNYLRKD